MAQSKSAAALDRFEDPQHFPFDKWQVGAAHPECAEDELFLGYGNGYTFGVVYARYTTKRKGNKVIDDLDRDRTADATDFFPIFVKKLEYDHLLAH